MLAANMQAVLDQKLSFEYITDPQLTLIMLYYAYFFIETENRILDNFKFLATSVYITYSIATFVLAIHFSSKKNL